MDKEELERYGNLNVGDRVKGPYGEGCIISIVRDPFPDDGFHEITVFVKYDGGMTSAEYLEDINKV